MNNNLISLEQTPFGTEAVQTVNARDIHAFLEVGKMFAHWIQDRIRQHGFVENQDFVCLPILASKDQPAGRGGHNRMEYHLTIEAAKHISMSEHTEKGKEARDYFIRCEKELRSLQTSGLLLVDATRGSQDLLAARYVMTIKAYRKEGYGALEAAIRADQALADQGYNMASVVPELRVAARGPWQALLSIIALTPVQVYWPAGVEEISEAMPTIATVLDALPSRYGRSELLQPVGLCAVNIKKVPHLVIPNASTRFAKLVLKGSAWSRDGSWLETLADVPGVLMNQSTPGLYKAGALTLGAWVPLDALRQAVAWQRPQGGPQG
jgi:phage anti-repressor protein